VKCRFARSLKGRVLAVLGVTITLCWAGALTVLVVYTLRGQSSHWDSKLQAIGTKILMSIPSGRHLKPSFGHSLQLRDDSIPRDVNLTFQVWTERKNLIVRAPDSPPTPLLPAFNDGFTSCHHRRRTLARLRGVRQHRRGQRSGGHAAQRDRRGNPAQDLWRAGPGDRPAGRPAC
jgi:hypothetical protein